VRLVIVGLKEVRVVRGEHRKPEFIPELEDLLVQLRLTVRVVALHLQVVPAVEQIGVPRSGFPGAGPVVRLEVARHLSGHARRGDDESLVVLRQDLTVHTGLVVEALRVPHGRELHQVLVALQVAGQKDQVVVGAFALSGAGAVPSITGRYIRLHPDDGLEALFGGLLVEAPGSEHAAVVGECQPRHLELFRLPDQVANAVGAVEEGILGVSMEVDEAH
jgi:hypothetical protein